MLKVKANTAFLALLEWLQFFFNSTFLKNILKQNTVVQSMDSEIRIKSATLSLPLISHVTLRKELLNLFVTSFSLLKINRIASI